MVANRVGSPVRGEEFYGRERFVDLLAEKLRTGHHVLLAAPRRFGKTSVMYRLMDRAEPQFRYVHVDLEHLAEPIDFLTKLIEALAKTEQGPTLTGRLNDTLRKFWSGFREAVEEVDVHGVRIKLKTELRSQWQEQGDILFGALAGIPATVIFILDELPMMIDRMVREDRRDEAIELLRWLRALRQRPDIVNLRFLLAGSIGIERVLNELGEISAINDFEKLRLEPFPERVAREFIGEVAKTEGFELPEDCVDAMLTAIGTPVPYFIQILFSEIAKAHKLSGEPIDVQMVTAIYRNKVLGVDCKTYFEHYYTRLRDYYRPHEERAVKRILRELAVTEGLSREVCFQLYKEVAGENTDLDAFHILMADLENEFYVRYDLDDQRYLFACKLLRDWWLRHYGMAPQS